MIEKRKVRCSILAVGDFPEGGATSQRLYLLSKIINEGLGEASLWILHPTTKVFLQENVSNCGVWKGVKFLYLSGNIIRPATKFGALIDTTKGIYKSVSLLASSEYRPDVLVVYTPLFLQFIIPMLSAKLLGIPVIVESCEIFSKSLDKAKLGIIRRWANSGQSMMEQLIPKLSKGILAISRQIKSYYESLGLAKNAAYLLPVLIDAGHYQGAGNSAVDALQGRRFLLNSTGTYSEKDGIPYLIDAITQVRLQKPEIKLVFTGFAAPAIQEKIYQMAGAGSQDWIIFTGFLSRDQLIWCYKHAAGLLSCRSNSSFANYGFPTKLAEYLCSGSPVIATRVGDVEEYLADGQNAYLATPEDVNSIAGAIFRLLENPEQAVLIGSSGAEVARQFFDYRNHVNGVANFIRQRISLVPES